MLHLIVVIFDFQHFKINIVGLCQVNLIILTWLVFSYCLIHCAKWYHKLPGAEWQAFPPSTAGCGTEFLSDVGGEIISPGYPHLPAVESQCTWTIRTDVTRKIMLHFRDFNLGNLGKHFESFLELKIDHLMPAFNIAGSNQWIHQFSPWQFFYQWCTVEA